MNFTFVSPTTTANSAFGAANPSTGLSFAGGDTKPFGAPATDNKAAFNFTSATPSAPSFGGGGFAFGSAKPATSTPSLFGTPAPTTTASAFVTNKPLSFAGFASPPNQTVGSPGFGQPVQQGTTQNLSFGSAVQQSSPAPAFGSPVQTTNLQTSQAQPPAFGSSNTSFSLGFNKPATTTAFGGFQTPPSGFSSVQQPATATTASAPQTSQPSSAFGATTTSSSFGFGAKPAFGFGAATGQPTTAPAPAYGTPTAAPTTGLTAFGTPQPQPQTTGLTSNPSTGLNFGQTPAFGAQTSAPTLGRTTLSFNQTAPATTQAQSFNFASTTPSFGATQPVATQPVAQQPAGLNFKKTTQSPGLSFGTSQPSQLSFSATTAAQSLTQPTATTAQPVLSFGTTTSQSTLNFPQTSLPASTQPAQPTQPPLSFTSTPAPTPAPISAPAPISVPTPAPTTVLSFGTTTAPTTGISLGLSFGKTTATTATAGIPTSKPATSFGLPSSQPSSTAATTTPSGIAALGKTTAATTITTTSLVPTTTTAASLPTLPAGPPAQITSLTFSQLQENINKWTIELEEQEKTFINQATQINAWDTLLIANGEKIVELNDAVQTVKNDQQSLEHELDFILAQQKELEELLAPLEKQLAEDTGDRMRDAEREMMYNLAENLDTQLRQMSEDLKEVIEHLNETNRSQDSNDPIVQIGRILNAHMSSMQWIDTSIAQISTKLDQLKATHDTLRRDNERSFQLTYN